MLALAFLLVPLGFVLVRGVGGVTACLESHEIRAAIWLSLSTATLSTVLCLVITIPVVMALHRLDDRSKTIVESVLYVPMSLPHLIAGISLLLLYGRNGIGDYVFHTFGVDFVYTQAGIVLAQVFINLPFAIKTLMQSIDEVDTKQIFVARTLGASTFASYRHVVLPQIAGGVTTSIIMNWARAIGEFGAVMMLAGTMRMRTEVIPTAIFLSMSTGETDIALGLSTILIAITLVAIAIYQVIDQRRVAIWA